MKTALSPPSLDTEAEPPPSHQRASRLATLGLFAVLITPLVVAAAALHRKNWFPVLDMAMTELRVRDVFTSDTPLIGLPGRIGRTIAGQGSHPGP